MKTYRNSHGQTVKITPGVIKCLKKRSKVAVKPEVLEVIERLYKKSLGPGAKTTLESVGFELNVRIDTIMEIMKDLCKNNLLTKIGREYSVLRNVKESDYN